MTTLDAKQLLLIHFIKNDSLSYENIGKLIPSKQKKDECEYAIVAALNELTASLILSEMIKNQDKEDESKIWILNKSLSLYEQSVTIDGQLATKISGISNNFYQMVGEKSLNSNPLNITKDDILCLLEIINLYASNTPQEKE